MTRPDLIAADWKTEARGLPVWPGAFVVHGEESDGPAEDYAADTVCIRDGMTFWPAEECSPDLANPDTLAAFDRRLALRLGAPEEAVAQGVIVRLVPVGDPPPWPRFVGDRGGMVLDMMAGLRDQSFDAPVAAWTYRDHHGDDPLTARVRAWRSVADSPTP